MKSSPRKPISLCFPACFLLLLAAATAQAQSACDPVPAGLISWWQADGDASDAAGLNNGTLVNGVTIGPGEVGEGFNFNGQNQYVQIPDSASLRTTSVTLECWFQANASGASGNLISKPVGANASDSYDLWFQNGDLNGLVGNTNGFQSVSFRLNPVPGSWYHAAYTFDSSSEIQTLYLNGKAVATRTATIQPMFDSHSVFIGAEFDFGSLVLPWNGEINQPTIYGRALSSSEVAAIYGAGSQGKCPLASSLPAVVSQPTNQTVLAGSAVAFGVAALGGPELNFQWQFDGTAIDGATNISLTINDITFAEAGSYSVIVSNAFGATASSNAVLTVNPLPSCLPDPAGLVSWWSGNSTTMDMAGTNNGTAEGLLSYGAGEVGQAFSLDGSSAYVLCPPSPSLNVGTGGGLTIECWINPSDTSNPHPLVEWNSGTTYGSHFWIGQAAGDLYANLIDVSNQFHILQTTNGLIHAGQFQHVAVTYNHTNGTGALYYNGAVVATQNLGVFTPLTSSDLFIGHRPNAGVEYYAGLIDEVSLYKRALSAGEISAIFQVGSEGKCLPCLPIATASVTNGSVAAATIVNGGCELSNAPVVLIEGGGGTGAAATAVVSNGTVIDILISNGGTGYTNAPEILFGEPPSIVAQPTNVLVAANQPASFTVAAIGTGLGYQWSLNGAEITGATGSGLAISNVVQEDLGSYSVTVKNLFGSVPSSNAVLSMFPIIVEPVSNSVIYLGQSNTLMVGAWGTGPISYQWLDDGNPISGATNNVLVFADVQAANAGTYSVVVSNAFGSVTNPPETVTVELAGISLGLSPTLTINGAAGSNYIIQRTAAFAVNNSWVTVTNLTLTQSVELWVDTNINIALPGAPQEFYRVLPGQ